MATKNCWNDDTECDFTALVGSSNRYLRLRTTPVGMRRFRNESELERIHRLRRPTAGEKFETNQIVDESPLASLAQSHGGR